MNPAIPLLRALLLLALFATSALAADPTPAATGDKLDPKQIEVTLTPDKASILPGEPVFFTLTLKIKSAPDFLLFSPLPRLPVAGMGLSVTDQDGRAAPPPGIWFDLRSYFDGGPQVPPLLAKPPFPSEYTYRLFLPFSASLQKPGTYSITASVTLAFNRYEEHRPSSFTSVTPSIYIPVQASAKLEVTQPDEKKLGEIIDNLVKRAGPDNPGAVEADLMLASIPDERVVPYFRGELEQALKKGWVAEQATLVLGQFNSDSALDALKECMEIPAAEKTGIKNRSLADTIHTGRLFAAEALAESPHPGAIPYLITRRNDPYYMVRSEIVRVLGTKVPPAQAIPLLKEMTTDENVNVRKEAKDALKKLTAKNSTKTPRE